MKREDVRDEALGVLLREAAEASAEAAERAREVEVPGPGRIVYDAGRAASGRPGRRPPSRIRVRIAGWAALAAGLAAALTVPALARRQAEREFIAAAAGHLSRSLIRESSSFLAELPPRSDLESAAADWAGSLFPVDTGL